eukprot:NODE_13_length_54415_cov_0.522424.p53 type:complete len:106 gc:universal NODE_13_length_54415_cov_0.522424:40987-40670(-)
MLRLEIRIFCQVVCYIFGEVVQLYQRPWDVGSMQVGTWTVELVESHQVMHIRSKHLRHLDKDPTILCDAIKLMQHHRSNELAIIALVMLVVLLQIVLLVQICIYT